MTKSELIDALAKKQPHLALKDVELAVKCIIEKMNQALSSGERIEIRGFGSFSLHKRPPRMGRNPKTGESVALAESMSPILNRVKSYGFVSMRPVKNMKY